MSTEPWDKIGGYRLFDTRSHILHAFSHFSVCCILSTLEAVAELLLIVKTSALTFIVAVLMRDVWNVMGGIIFAGDKLLEGETVGFQFVGLGLFLYVWHRYQTNSGPRLRNEEQRQLFTAQVDEFVPFTTTLLSECEHQHEYFDTNSL
ncbi:unnamed protein product [Sphagnum compactum]